MKVSISANIKNRLKHPDANKTRHRLTEIFCELRHLWGMTQGEVATAVGLSRTSVTNIETGKQGVTLEVLDKLANHLGLEVVVEIRDTNPPSRL